MGPADIRDNLSTAASDRPIAAVDADLDTHHRAGPAVEEPPTPEGNGPTGDAPMADTAPSGGDAGQVGAAPADDALTQAGTGQPGGTGEPDGTGQQDRAGRSPGDAVFTTEARAAWSKHEVAASSEAIAVERIDDADEVAAMLRSLADGTRRQLLSALPQGEYSVELLRSSWDVDLAMLARGVDVRVVYPAETARKPAFLQYLSDFANAGAAVRISAKVPHRIVVSDRRTAVVPVHPEEPSRAALVMREPVVVASVCAQFTALWRTAWPVGVSVKNGLDVDLIRDTLTALAKWPTDETAARHLGTSVRTLRRRIAAIMELLGASSRFEAGLKAQEGGWI